MGGKLVSVVSVDQPVIFIHIPKAAGSAIKQSFRSMDSFLEWGHQSYSAYSYLLGKKKYNDSFSFAFVRNPWDRLVSEYFFIRDGQNSKHNEFFQKHLAQYPTFSDFVVKWLSEKTIYLYSNFIPQYKFITDFFGQIKVSHVARFELFNDELDFFVEDIKV